MRTVKIFFTMFIYTYICAIFITLEPNVFMWSELGRIAYLWSSSAFSFLALSFKEFL